MIVNDVAAAGNISGTFTKHHTLKKYVEENGFTVVYDPKPDGSCQFASLCHQLSRLELSSYCTAEGLRNEVVDYLSTETCDTFATFVQKPASLSLSDGWQMYLLHMRKLDTFGDNLTLLAVARLYNVQIVVLSTLGLSSTALIGPICEDTHRIAIDSSLPLIYLGHSAEQYGEHYVSVAPKSEETFRTFLANFSSTESASAKPAVDDCDTATGMYWLLINEVRSDFGSTVDQLSIEIHRRCKHTYHLLIHRH